MSEHLERKSFDERLTIIERRLSNFKSFELANASRDAPIVALYELIELVRELHSGNPSASSPQDHRDGHHGDQGYYNAD